MPYFIIKAGRKNSKEYNLKRMNAKENGFDSIKMNGNWYGRLSSERGLMPFSE
jgi:hypothetical protein